MKKLLILCIPVLLISCNATKTKTNPQTLLDSSVERVVNNGSFDTYKVKVDTMEFIVFRGSECISSIRIK